jgi:hypothetical protein
MFPDILSAKIPSLLSLTLAAVNIRVGDLHPAFGRFQAFKAAILPVKFVGIAGSQHKIAQTLQIRVGFNAFHQPLR